jgi:hypothetical protein
MYYRVLDDLPKVPEELEKRLMSLTEDDEPYIQDRIRTSKFWNRTGKPGQIQSFPKIELAEREEGIWFKENIHPTATYYQLLKNIESGDNFWPHTDRTRKVGLMYLLQTGGDPDTVFYRTTDGSPVQPAQTWPDYENLTEVDRIKIPLHTWVLLDVSKPHSVEGMKGQRISVQLAFDDNIFGPV